MQWTRLIFQVKDWVVDFIAKWRQCCYKFVQYRLELTDMFKQKCWSVLKITQIGSDVLKIDSPTKWSAFLAHPVGPLYACIDLIRSGRTVCTRFCFKHRPPFCLLLYAQPRYASPIDWVMLSHTRFELPLPVFDTAQTVRSLKKKKFFCLKAAFWGYLIADRRALLAGTRKIDFSTQRDARIAGR